MTREELLAKGWAELDFKQMVGLAAHEGLVIELGVAEGATLREICSATTKTVYGFDWFYGLPEAWGEKMAKGAFSTDGKLPENLPANSEIVVGMLQDTLSLFLVRQYQKIAFVHFDLDLYSSTRFSLIAMAPYFQTGTVLLFDEIIENHNVEHEQRAFLEFIDMSAFNFAPLGQRHGESLCVILYKKKEYA